MQFIVEAAYLSTQSLDEFIMLIGSCRVADDNLISVVCAFVSTSATSANSGNKCRFVNVLFHSDETVHYKFNET